MQRYDNQKVIAVIEFTEADAELLRLSLEAGMDRFRYKHGELSDIAEKLAKEGKKAEAKAAAEMAEEAMYTSHAICHLYNRIEGKDGKP